jgi:putative transposase
MANTYTQLYAHIVFAVKGRANVITPTWKQDLHKYIAGVISNKQQKVMAINGMADHIHILLGFKPECNLSDIVRDIKANSSRWVNENKLVSGKFEWQTGFGAFTVSQSQTKNVIQYILKQEQHHRTKSFREEYISFLEEYEIKYVQEYLPDDIGTT